MTRISTLANAASFWSAATSGVDKDGNRVAADSLTRYVWLAAGAAGVATFALSFAALALPLIAGWTWLGAGIAFIATQYASQVLLDLPEYWKKASAYCWLVRHLWAKDVEAQLNSTESHWNV